MACEQIEARLAELREQKEQQELVIAQLKGHALEAAQQQLENIEDEIAEEQQKLADCRAAAAQAANTTPQPFRGHVQSITSLDSGKELGKDEPYVLVASVDMLAGVTVGPLPVPKPAVHCFRIGPWSKVRTGDTRMASELLPRDNPRFWDLNGQPRLINQPQDALFVLSVIENDGSSPDAIRGAAETNLNGSIVQNMGRAFSTFADTLESAMNAAIDSARVLGLSPAHVNADDRIDTAKQLVLTAADLTDINTFGHVDRSLTFRRKKTSGKVTDAYTVRVRFEV